MAVAIVGLIGGLFVGYIGAGIDALLFFFLTSRFKIDPYVRVSPAPELRVPAQLIVLDDEELEEDVVLGAVDPSEDARERCLTVDEEFHRVLAE